MADKATRFVGKLKSRVFIVEDHPITRNGLAQLINYQDDLRVCGHADSVPKPSTAWMKPNLIL